MFTPSTEQLNISLPSASVIKLKQLLMGVGELLASSNVEISPDELKSFTDLIEATGGDRDTEKIEASTLTDQIYTVNWFSQVNRAISIFKEQFCLVFEKPISEFRKEHGEEVSRDAIAQDMVKDITSILRQYIKTFPQQAIDDIREKHHESDAYMYPPIFASRKTDSPDSKDKNIIILGTANVTDVKESGIEASANQTPCSGVLFLVDEPSESAPSKGSEYPLYVSREVAERCVEAIAKQPGLPLDIDDSLMQHSKSNITGVITSAEIQGNQFIVHGHLFPWSQENKIALITANRRDLGMSMNAHATGHSGVVNGQKVFWIDHLELLGANILKASHATYQQTKFWASEVAAAAETSDPNLPTGDNIVNIEEQLDQISTTLNSIVQAAQRDSDRVNSLEQKFDTKFKVLEEIEAARKQQMEADRQKQIEAAKQQEQQSLLEAVNALIAENNKNLLKAINPSGSPRRLAPLIQASGNDEEALPPLNNVERRLLQVRGRLIEARSNKEPGYIRAKLIEEEKALEMQMQNAAVL